MFCQILPLFAIIASCLAAYGPDEVLDLPGMPAGAPPFKQYSGYLNATGDRLLHYWFVESQGNPSTDPLILWLNGGPGCSSMDGYLSEIGPFHMNNDGASLYLNEYSWNRMANVIFLDSPAGVGFSYSPSGNIKTGDRKTAEDNYLALKNFFVKFPEYQMNSFFLTGESYAGIYIPTLAMKILNGNNSINMQGFAIGNGLLNTTTNKNSAIYYAYYHAIFDQSLWIDLQNNCCDGGKCEFYESTNPQCKIDYDVAESFISSSGLNTYAIYSDCAGGIPSQEERYRFDLSSALGIDYKPPHRPVRKMQTNGTRADIQYSSHGFTSDKVDKLDCINTTAETVYLNRPDVRLALHIPDSVQPWQICSEAVKENYTKDYQSVEPQVLSLLKNYRGLFYNGDVDIVCNFLGNQWFVKDLNKQETTPRRAWMVDSQVAGFVHTYTNLTFATVKAAGHLVPQWKPAEAYHLITQFMNNQPL